MFYAIILRYLLSEQSGIQRHLQFHPVCLSNLLIEWIDSARIYRLLILAPPHLRSTFVYNTL
jgi:hypothetical protein